MVLYSVPLEHAIATAAGLLDAAPAGEPFVLAVNLVLAYLRTHEARCIQIPRANMELFLDAMSRRRQDDGDFLDGLDAASSGIGLSWRSRRGQ